MYIYKKSDPIYLSAAVYYIDITLVWWWCQGQPTPPPPHEL